jgi:hypothetical protein
MKRRLACLFSRKGSQPNQVPRFAVVKGFSFPKIAFRRPADRQKIRQVDVVQLVREITVRVKASAGDRSVVIIHRRNLPARLVIPNPAQLAHSAFKRRHF